jgi:hypothetical protein
MDFLSLCGPLVEGPSFFVLVERFSGRRGRALRAGLGSEAVAGIFDKRFRSKRDFFGLPYWLTSEHMKKIIKGWLQKFPIGWFIDLVSELMLSIMMHSKMNWS